MTPFDSSIPTAKGKLLICIDCETESSFRIQQRLFLALVIFETFLGCEKVSIGLVIRVNR